MKNNKSPILFHLALYSQTRIYFTYGGMKTVYMLKYIDLGDRIPR